MIAAAGFGHGTVIGGRETGIRRCRLIVRVTFVSGLKPTNLDRHGTVRHGAVAEPTVAVTSPTLERTRAQRRTSMMTTRGNGCGVRNP
jgi:hypothetical protein